MEITIKTINKKNLLKNYIESSDRHNGINEMLKFYSKFGCLHKFRIGLPSLCNLRLPIINGMNYNVDYVLNKIAGTSHKRLTISDSIFSGGKGLTLADCFASALGESFERIFGSFESFNKNENQLFGSFNELSKGKNFLKPSTYTVFLENEYEDEKHSFEKFTEDTPLLWCKMLSPFKNKQELWVPAQFLYLLYLGKKGESLIGYSSSGGLSCHNTLNKTFSHGMLEIIERDAINICWNCKIPPKKIIIQKELLTGRLKKIFDRFSYHMKDITFYLHQTDESYVVTAIKKDTSLSKYYFLAGGGVGSCIDEAIEGALTEFIQAENNLKNIIYTPDWSASAGINFMFNVPEDVNPKDLKLFYQIIPYYGYDKNFKKLNWYLNDGETIEYTKLTSEKRISDVILKNYFYIDITPNQFESIKITKLFNSKMTPAYISSMPMQGHFKYKLHIKEDDKLTSDPIPFP